MKVKPTQRTGRGGGVVVELGPREVELPGSRPTAAVAALPAFKLRKILVPVDFSECSRKALEYAVPFARQFGAEVDLLFVVQPYYPVSDMVPVDVEAIEVRMRETGEQELAALKKSMDPDLKVATVVRIGNPHVEIVRAAKELEADLIILSTHGRTGLSHVVMGSTTERVVRHAGCPVLVLREQEHEFVVA
jgi:nucleotide-binding universal stress UspA family protein